MLESEKAALFEKVDQLQAELANSEENWRQVQASKDQELQVSYQTAENNRKKRE